MLKTLTQEKRKSKLLYSSAYILSSPWFSSIVACSSYWQKIFAVHPNQHICYKTKLRKTYMKWIVYMNCGNETIRCTDDTYGCYWSILCLQTLICRFLSDCGVFIPNWFSSLFPNPSKRPAVVNKKVKSVPQHTASTLHWAGILTCNKKNKAKSFFYRWFTVHFLVRG